MHTKRIARGARFMDREFPGWETRVDASRLNPDDPRDCALGQETGDFEDFMDRRYFTGWRDSRDPHWFEVPSLAIGGTFMLRHGFSTIRETDEQWRAAWTAEIEKRLAGGRPMGMAERFRRRWLDDQVAQEWTLVIKSEKESDEQVLELMGRSDQGGAHGLTGSTIVQEKSQEVANPHS